MRRRHIIGLVTVGLFLIVIVLFRAFNLARFFSLTTLQSNATLLSTFSRDYYLLSILAFVTVFSSIIIFSIPVTGPFTLLGGFLFGMLRGALFSTVGAIVGATLSFFIFRRGLSDFVQQKYGDKLKTFKRNIKHHGGSYLLMLQFSTVVPYGVINMLAALSGVPLWTFLWTTALGFMPYALIYTFAGSRFTTITSVGDIFSPSVIAAFVLLMLLSIVPLIVRRLRGGRSL